MSATQTPPMEAPRDAQVTPMNRDAGGERPNIVTTMVRLRWSLMFAAMRKSPWQVVGYVLALLMALGIVVGAGLAAFALTGGAVEWNEAAFAVLRVVMVNAGTVGIIFAALQTNTHTHLFDGSSVQCEGTDNVSRLRCH